MIDWYDLDVERIVLYSHKFAYVCMLVVSVQKTPILKTTFQDCYEMYNVTSLDINMDTNMTCDMQCVIGRYDLDVERIVLNSHKLACAYVCSSTQSRNQPY